MAARAPKQAVAQQLHGLLASFELSLRAANKAPRTIETYSESVRQLIDYLEAAGLPTDLQQLEGEHIERFEIHLHEAGRSAATVSVRHRSLVSFFNWCVTEGEVDVSPMAKLAAPIVPEQPVPVPPDDDLRRLLAVLRGDTFEQTRDAALLRLLVDTGLRASEVIGLRLEDVDIHGTRQPTATVLGKGRRPRTVPLGSKTALAVDRYLRKRARNEYAGLDALWISRKGPLTTSGLRQLMERRCDQAGIPRIHPHALRHHFAHSWLLQAGAENELMALTGWKSRAMLSRYAASTVAERAAESHRRLSPGDRI